MPDMGEHEHEWWLIRSVWTGLPLMRFCDCGARQTIPALPPVPRPYDWALELD